jgi:hypothetical protein
MIRWLAHLFVMVAVMLLVANYYWNNGAGVPDYVYYAVAILVAALPVAWAGLHIGGGLLLGIASGGVLDGLRLGLILGLGMALSKLWPAAFGAGAGMWIGGGPKWHMITAFVVGVLLFGLDKALAFFWRSTTSPRGEG